ncbi:MAG: bifunctional (p)ppGpp synthetase/guanosine-3',5'-bis(diphosphate) 3'-pyrophosphohydrolase [Bacilli bacterium]|nr:bifunctional (p)ppGpp synthetase/guanosine-3',5'-bis(diphosphate) 3'-pyrophosphohydrolase [Bacilli bacterium]
MNGISYNDLLNSVKGYINNSKDLELIQKSFSYASKLHKGQKRQSGEDYISHPLSVAFILSEMKADTDTVCAALLHDTIEDTSATKDKLEVLFNKDIATLVDGVTKISKMNFSTRDEMVATNTRKIITSLDEDVRIVIIKLADRLHNMRTLGFKSELKQRENSLETMEIFVPLAYYLGAYQIKGELEDLSFSYLKPELYTEINITLEKTKAQLEEITYELLQDISKILVDKNIPFELQSRVKNVYGIYKNMSRGKKISDIHDLLAIKIIVDEIKDCYLSLGAVHSRYTPINSKFKDYIAMPKTNMYSSLHTTVFGPNDRLVQMQIRTRNMNLIDTYGLTAYWDLNKGDAATTMQEDLKTKFQFFKSLTEINALTADNQEFVSKVKEELFDSNIYVYTSKGEIIELPYGSTPIDFAYKLHTDIGNTMVGAIVNDTLVAVDYILQNKDRVKILTDSLSFGPRDEWQGKAYTMKAKRMIREFSR